MSEPAQIDIEEVPHVRKPRDKKAVAIVKPEQPAVPVTVDNSPMVLLKAALDRGADMGVLEKLMDLQDRWESSQARKAFDSAMAAAKAEIPPIFKNKVVDFTSQKGRTNYRHEDLAEIARTVDPILARYGLSYRFRTKTDATIVEVICIVSHREGYFEENSLSAGHDHTGNKNSIQAIGSTITFLQRYTLKAALGLSASSDDDGKASALADDGPITEDQLAELIELADEVGADKAKFCRYAKVDSLADIQKSKFEAAKSALRAKGRSS